MPWEATRHAFFNQSFNGCKKDLLGGGAIDSDAIAIYW